jgi:predicted NUDIX family phosphoesterase
MQSDSIFDWARREFHEEVCYAGDLTFEAIGVLNDDANDVGKVHLGLVIVVRGDSDAIAVKSELKSGALLSLDEIAPFYDQLESWSQTVYTYLIS